MNLYINQIVWNVLHGLIAILILFVPLQSQPNFTAPTKFSILDSTSLSGVDNDLMIMTSDGGVLRGGYIDSSNAILSKVSATGDIEWETVLNRDSSMYLSKLSEDDNGNFLACGYIYLSGNSIFQSEGILHAVLLDKKGTIIWKMPIDTSVKRYLAVLNPIVTCTDGLLAILTIKSANYNTFSIIPALRFYDIQGNIVKEILYDSLHSATMNIAPFLYTRDKGFLALVHCELGTKTFEQLWRIDSSGTLLWKQEWSDVPYSQFGNWSSAIEAKDGGFVVVTTAPKAAGISSIIMRKFDTSGVQLFKKQYGAKVFSAVAQIHETPNGDILMVGYGYSSEPYIGSDICIYRTNPSGKLLWQDTFGDSTKGDYGKSIAVIDDHNFYIGYGTGKNLDLLSGTKPHIVKVTDITSSVEGQSELDAFTISPNPTSTSFTLRGIDNISSMKILNSIGMEVSRMSFKESGKQEVDVSNLPSGVYFVQIRTSTGMISKPIVISR